MTAYSIDLRKRVIAAIDAGATQEAVAKRYSVSVGWVNKIVQQRNKTGDINPLKKGGHRPPSIEGKQLERLKEAVKNKSDATLEEYRTTCKATCSIMSVSRALKRLGFTRKKRPFGPRNKTVLT